VGGKRLKGNPGTIFGHIVGTREKRCWEINVKRVGGFHVYGRSNWLTLVPHRRYLGLESGGHSVRTSTGLPPLCTVGAAEFEPPASGRIAPFSIAMEFDVFSSALPEVAADDVVQFVSCFSRDGAVDWATATPATTNPAKIATAIR
jgi:hypothetical protein